MNWTTFTNFFKPFATFVVVLLLTAQLGFAQITLTQDNFPVQGDVFNYITVDATTLSAGTAGADVAWDFSDLTGAGSATSGTYVNPVGTMFGGNFPTSTIAEETAATTNYYEVTSTEASWVGRADPDGTVFTYSDPLIQMTYPFTYLDSFVDEGDRQYNVGVDVGSHMTMTVVADAYGTLTLPVGTFEDVLRVQSIQTFRDTVPSNPGQYFEAEFIRYEWFTADSRDPLFTFETFTTDQSGAITTGANAFYADIPVFVDDYGYSWEDSASGLACDWIDLTEIGTVVAGLADDNFVGPFDMGIDFQYYWTTVNQIYIGSNGYVSFDGYNISSTAIGFPNIPTADGFDDLVAPLMCDLTFATTPGGLQNPGRVYYWSNNVDMFVISYENVPLWTNNANQFTGSNTFQVVFNAAEGTITFNYQDVEAEPATEYAASPNPVVLGIENISGDIGIQISSNAFPPDFSCVRFSAPDVPLIDVVDATPAWNQNSDNGGFFLAFEDFTNLTTLISNVGSVDVPSDIMVDAEILTSAGADFLSMSETISGIPFGESELITFSDPFPAFIADTYTYRVSISNPDDINAGNNVTESELVVVEPDFSGESALAYVTGSLVNPGVVSWSGAAGFDDGAGIYIEPPFYPAEVVGAEFLIMPPGGAADVTTGFRTQVVAPDPVTNAPSTVITSEDVAVGTILPSSWNRVDYTDKPIIEEGGFYVSWLMEEAGIALATDDQPPFSRRTYEILSGTWAPYRSINVEDMYIRVFVKSPEAEGIGDPIVTPTLQMSHAYPNPTDGMTQIQYNLPKTGDVLFAVINTLGQEVLRQNYGQVAAGEYTIELNANHLPSGTYIYSIIANGQKMSKQMVVVK